MCKKLRSLKTKAWGNSCQVLSTCYVTGTLYYVLYRIIEFNYPNDHLGYNFTVLWTSFQWGSGMKSLTPNRTLTPKPVLFDYSLWELLHLTSDSFLVKLGYLTRFEHLLPHFVRDLNGHYLTWPSLTIPQSRSHFTDEDIEWWEVNK